MKKDENKCLFCKNIQKKIFIYWDTNDLKSNGISTGDCGSGGVIIMILTIFVLKKRNGITTGD